jgi:hypothetical protein
LRYKKRLEQRLEYIDWEYDEMQPQLDEFLGRAQIPEAPSDMTLDVVLEEGPKPKGKRRAARRPA